MIAGGTALAVGKPGAPTPLGFEWTPLSAVARLETGHTPSRKHPEYWDGDIPWIGVRDATGNHGRTITSTNQTVTQAGIENSSARILPAGTVCLSRTASVGFVVTMGVPMATSQDFVNWVCGPGLDGRYLKFVLQFEHQTLQRFASGTTHQTIYFPEAKAFHVLLPQIAEQQAIAGVLGALDDKIDCNRSRAECAEELLDALAGTLPSTGQVEIADLAEVDRLSIDPSGSPVVDHYSLPAFDAARLPERVQGASIRSNKLTVQEPSVLVSRLNPGTNRTWYAVPDPAVPAVASTEWLVLRPVEGLSLGGLWLAVRDVGFRGEIARRATGTSGSHQRVRPADALSIEVPDPRGGDPSVAKEADALLDLVQHARVESETLAALRDTLLPELLSGRLRVPAAEELVAGAV